MAWTLVSGILLSRGGTGDGTEAEYGQKKLVSGRPKMTHVHVGERSGEEDGSTFRVNTRFQLEACRLQRQKGSV